MVQLSGECIIVTQRDATSKIWQANAERAAGACATFVVRLANPATPRGRGPTCSAWPSLALQLRIEGCLAADKPRCRSL